MRSKKAGNAWFMLDMASHECKYMMLLLVWFSWYDAEAAHQVC
jgi:hypothetical protein